MLAAFTLSMLSVLSPNTASAQDPWNIIGEDTALLAEDEQRKNFIVSVIAIERLGDFFVNQWVVGESLKVEDNILTWDADLNEGEFSYDLMLDYNLDGCLTIEDFYGYLDDPRFETEEFDGYAVDVANLWTPLVEAMWDDFQCGNLWHNPDCPADVNMDGRVNCRDFWIVLRSICHHLYADRNGVLGQYQDGFPKVDVNDDGLLNWQDIRRVWRALNRSRRNR